MWEGKGAHSRLVPAHPELVDAFRSVTRRRNDDKVFHYCARTADRGMAQESAKAGLASVATRTGFKGPCSHGIRHCYARHWLQSGPNVNAVSACLGHSSPTVTLSAYLVLVSRVNYYCRPVASPENVTETLAPGISSRQRHSRQSAGWRWCCSSPGVNQLLGHDAAPLFQPALHGSQLGLAEPVRVF